MNCIKWEIEAEFNLNVLNNSGVKTPSGFMALVGLQLGTFSHQVIVPQKDLLNLMFFSAFIYFFSRFIRITLFIWNIFLTLSHSQNLVFFTYWS